MRIFISYSREDQQIADLIFRRLQKEGHHIFYDKLNIKDGDNWFTKINEGIKDFDAIVILISESSLNSKWALKEIESLMLNDLSKRDTRIIPIITDGSRPPGYLANYVWLDMSNDIQYGLAKLSDSLKGGKISKQVKSSDYKTRNHSFILEISKSLKEGKLTLVCGAGISIGANIPSWNELLLRLLDSMISRISDSQPIVFKNIKPKDFQGRLGSSSLVMGKYLKSNLGKDFLPELREALYMQNPTTCDLIESIVELSRPQRDGKPLDSIITFNFDGLLEENLDKSNIKHKAIDQEGIRNNSTELPIYHVHGYLPRKGKITSNQDVVFSEDAYHTQFIDPFSWSNLIQLNKLSQNTCLFIGLSLTDPNLRRLLDVANRKDPTKNLNHYIIKKTPDVEDNSGKVDELLMFLEEQDANELGLNVLWVDEFNEMPTLLRKLIE